MIDHSGITVSDIVASRDFYEAALAALGYAVIIDRTTSVGFGVREGFGKSADPGGDFWVTEGKPMYPRVHFAFGAASRTDVDSFYNAGLAAGGVANGAPGLRSRYHPHYYSAFLLDPDGYNIEVVCHLEIFPG